MNQRCYYQYDLKIHLQLMKIRNVVIIIICLTGVTNFLLAQQDNNPKLTDSFFGQELPGNIPQIFAPGIVSTDMYNHSSISISPDGKEIYWAMAPLDTPRRIYYSFIQNNGLWSEPEVIHFTQSEDGDCPVLSIDGKKMYFNSNRPINEGGIRRERIWCADRIEGEWGKPYPLGSEINGKHLHWQISVDKSGSIYFGSERSGSKGRDDIFYAKFSNRTYCEPVSLEESINSTEHESTPFVDPDGEYLIFCRNGLWISFKDADNNWSQAIKMGDLFDGVCPYVSPDGKYLFFLKMGIGYNDIYWVSAGIIEELRNN